MQRFQVDLSGLVALLSRHLYSGPQVFVRELMQNGVDAITAREQLELDAGAAGASAVDAGGGPTPASGPRIVLEVGEGRLEARDTGIGLTAAEAEELLATIGRSSKRDDDFGLGREEYIGQFGIGMLAAFMVAEQIEVLSRSARPGEHPIRWLGRDDGTFSVAPIGEDEAREAGLDGPGTLVRLEGRADMLEWFAPATIERLAREYGALLPIPVEVRAPGGDAIRISRPILPWAAPHPSAAARAAALRDYCERAFGFTPLGQIDFEVPVAGVTGVAFILPQAVAAGAHAHRVYVKRMLLSERTERLLPEWAFFVRAVADTALSPTASREALHETELLEVARESISAQLRAWIARHLATRSEAAHRFITTHHLALRSLATQDDEMRALVAQVLPYETTDGLLTLAEVAGRGEVVYTTTTEAYRRVSAVARAQGLVVVNAGYVYDSDILQRLAGDGWRVRELGSNDLVQVLREVGPVRQGEIERAVVAARRLLEAEDCDVLVRDFDPETTPAVLLRDREGEFQRTLSDERAAQGDAWADLLGAFEQRDRLPSRTLVLNDGAHVVRQLLASSGEVFEAGLTSLYLSAVMLAGEGLRTSEVAAMNEALAVLLGSSLKGSE